MALVGLKNIDESVSSLPSFASGKLRIRSGSPGNRNNVEKIISQSLKSKDPKEFLKTNFKSDMKKTGLNSDFKKLKNFKLTLMSRSHDNLDEQTVN